MAEPYPKSRQLARGERRYRRKIASPKQWAAIRAEKLDGQRCRFASQSAFEAGASFTRAEQLHHLVPRSLGGDDVADNLVGLCRSCHHRVTNRNPFALAILAESLSDAEYAYVISKLGEDGPRRLFGV